MTVELSPELEKVVQERVTSGLYANAEEFVREAILIAAEWEQRKRMKLNEAVAIGIEQADRGEFVDLDLDQINAELDAEFGYSGA